MPSSSRYRRKYRNNNHDFIVLECNCNGFSHRCFFDKELYEKTGHGGHCLDCAGNRDGPNCERCREDYYQRKGDTHCSPCDCDPVGKYMNNNVPSTSYITAKWTFRSVLNKLSIHIFGKYFL